MYTYTCILPPKKETERARKAADFGASGGGTAIKKGFLSGGGGIGKSKKDYLHYVCVHMYVSLSLYIYKHIYICICTYHVILQLHYYYCYYYYYYY